jgi:hypothetical protein
VTICPNCAASFKPRREHQVYCGDRCRKAAHAARQSAGAQRARVSKVSLLKGGKVSVVLTFLPIDRAFAISLEPGTLVEVVKP